jgi:hypothetical protein
MSPDLNRVQAWKDTLDGSELEEVERVEGMPATMAMGYVLVTLRREIEELRRPWWRQIVAPVGAAAAVAVAYLWPDVPRGPVP